MRSYLLTLARAVPVKAVLQLFFSEPALIASQAGTNLSLILVRHVCGSCENPSPLLLRLFHGR